MDNALFVAWRSCNEKGQWGPVGRLDFIGYGYRFVYTRGATMLKGFQPFSGMTNLDTVYESDELFPVFANRLLGPSRPEYEDFLTWGGFDPKNPPDPLSLLGITEGRRATDRIEVFPCPSYDDDGRFVTKFFLHRIRLMGTPALEKISMLPKGANLALMSDPMNSHDRDAVAVRTGGDDEYTMLGYVPRYLARDIRELCTNCDPGCIELTVMQVNQDAPLQQRLLCQMTACWPPDFRPCEEIEFQPLVQPAEHL